MLNLNKPTLMWGVAHESTSITGSLFTAELFTFKYLADAYIEEVRNELEDAGIGLFPVLIETVATVCGDDVAAAYDAEQVAWLTRDRGAA